MSATRFEAVVFDAYGTLFDVHSVAGLAERMYAGQGEALSQLWRSKQLEYSWLRTMSARYKSFSAITGDALDYAAERLGIRLDDPSRARLMDEYRKLAAFPENLPTLRTLRQSGVRLGILSNGNREMIVSSVDSAGMNGLFDHLLSSESVKSFKTASPIYELVPRAFGTTVDRILFVSSNCWDAIGSRWFGFSSFWINRAGAPVDRLDEVPTFQGRLLSDILPVVLHDSSDIPR